MKQYGRTLPKDQKSLIELAIAQDWNYSKTTAGHHRLVSPRGHIVIGSGTSSDTNSVWDFRARLKKAGLKPSKHRVKQKEEKQHVTTQNVPPVEPQAATTEKPKKTRMAIPGLRGGVMRDAMVEALRKHDKPEGLRAEEVGQYVNFRLGKQVPTSSVASSLRYYMDPKQGALFIKVSTGHYRLAEAYRVQETPVKIEDATPPSIITQPEPENTEDDDKALTKAMDQIVDALSTIDKIVRRANETRKKLRDILGEI